MKERPILFSGPMVRAILEGRKTQTRRVIAIPRRGGFALEGLTGGGWWPFQSDDGESTVCDDGIERPMRCPFGVPGDRLWVKETHLVVGGKDCADPRVVYRASNDGEDAWLSPVWTPSIHMPRWASRLLLEVKAVRVERLQEISQADARAEGIRLVTKDGTVNKFCVYDQGDYSSTPWSEMPRDAVSVYRSLWDSINAKRGHSWASNPWVWIVEFDLVTP